MFQKFFIIAGEASGDQLGAAVISELLRRNPQAKLRGIGGPQMLAAGLRESFIDMQELSLMGIVEILPRVPKLLKRIQQTVEAIRVFDPDVVLSIDCPDFSHRVQEELKSKGCRAKLIHMVAPTVWAWRPKRAEKISKFLDGLLCLFPFEPKYFEKYNLKSQFIGHPVMDSDAIKANGNAFRFRHMIGLDQNVLGVFFGSRLRELNTMAPVFIDAIRQLRSIDKDLVVLCPTTSYLAPHVRKILERENITAHIVTDQNEKWDSFAACNAAVATSGTVGLELAIVGVPHVIAYYVHPITWQMMKLLVKSKYAHLANIIMNEKVVPEFLQNDARSEKIAAELKNILGNSDIRHAQLEKFQVVRDHLKTPQQKKAAEAALDFIEDIVGN